MSLIRKKNLATFLRVLMCLPILSNQILHLSALRPNASENSNPCDDFSTGARPRGHKTHLGNLHRRQRISAQSGCESTQAANYTSNSRNTFNESTQNFGSGNQGIMQGGSFNQGAAPLPEVQEGQNSSNPQVSQGPNSTSQTQQSNFGSFDSYNITQGEAYIGGNFTQTPMNTTTSGDNNVTSSPFGFNSTSESSRNQTARSVTGLSSSFSSKAMQKNSLFLGFLPDDGASGGTRQTMAQLNSDIGAKSAAYGWYAQAHSGTKFDGSQLLAVIDDVKACNCIFQPAVMPVGGWQGLTAQDNSQAVAIAQVMKKFTDQGIPVWLRFAHEMNYYQTDGTYQGTAQDFKAGWAAVSAAVKQIAPSVKMWWTPNVASASNYASYEPNDMGTVDLVGIDYYPKKLSGNDFLSTMKTFHDKYAVNGRQFAIGETGLGWAGSTDDKQKWLAEICKAKSSLPQFLSMAWFNFDKEYNYKIVGEKSLDQKFTSFLAS